MKVKTVINKWQIPTGTAISIGVIIDGKPAREIIKIEEKKDGTK
jgi:hypothetical protein